MLPVERVLDVDLLVVPLQHSVHLALLQLLTDTQRLAAPDLDHLNTQRTRIWRIRIWTGNRLRPPPKTKCHIHHENQKESKKTNLSLKGILAVEVEELNEQQCVRVGRRGPLELKHENIKLHSLIVRPRSNKGRIRNIERGKW